MTWTVVHDMAVGVQRDIDSKIRITFRLSL